VILNVPGSPNGAVESLEAVIDILPHALQLLSGNTSHVTTSDE
jgi:molybdopterin biosynthesis enzyme MoaB